MRAITVVFLSCFLSVAVRAESTGKSITVKVLDPQSAAVAGAQVQLLRTNQSVAASEITSAEGIAIFHTAEAGPFKLKILAAGFAAETVDASGGELTVQLQLATAAETVVVSGTRTLVPGEASGANVDTLSASQLTTANPTAAADAVRFLPGAVVNAAGQRGGLTSLFVRGGESRYNKVIVDGVTINEPGGTFDFGTLPLDQADRMEFVRGAQSTLYGSDAMTSLVQVWTRTGSTHVPELRFGADGGNFSTARGYASLAGARGIFDYNVFCSQFNTNGWGINNAHSDSLQGANLGARLTDSVALRTRFRHSNSHTGVPGEWSFNGYVPLVPANGFSAPYEPLEPNPFQWS